VKTSFTQERKIETPREHKHSQKQHFPLTPQHSKYLGHFVFQLNKPTTVALAVFFLFLTNNYDFRLEVLKTMNMTWRSSGIRRIVAPMF